MHVSIETAVCVYMYQCTFYTVPSYNPLVQASLEYLHDLKPALSLLENKQVLNMENPQRKQSKRLQRIVNTYKHSSAMQSIRVDVITFFLILCENISFYGDNEEN